MSDESVEKFSVIEDELYLLRVSIGPVQEFISEARKTRDLFMGSLLLSKATYNSMKLMKDSIIYPYLNDSEDYLASIPNIYIAIIPKSKLYKTIYNMKKGLKDFWDDVLNKVNRKLPLDCKGYYNQKTESPFYINWVAVPIKIKELNCSYKLKVKDSIHFLNERKMTRTFEQWEGNYVQKCSQCGHREYALEIYPSVKKRFNTRIKENEKLCSICLLKRLLDPSDLGEDQKFDSVVDISAVMAKQLIDMENSKREVKEFIESISKIKKCLEITNKKEKFHYKNHFNYDFFKKDRGSHDCPNVYKICEDVNEMLIESYSGEFYYKDYLDCDFFKKEYGAPDCLNLKKICKDAKENLVEVYKSLGIKEPSKYYSILIMDGDDIGKLMSGEVKLASGEIIEDCNFTIDYQKKLSKILADTGINISKIIEDPDIGNGLCVYSGGDDLLSFLPLERTFSTSHDARSSFINEFNKYGISQTSSAGIVILHHKDPLRKGLEEARKNVEQAKELFVDKNAFCITLRLFSGAVVTWGSKWELEIPNLQVMGPIKVLDLLERFVLLMVNKTDSRLSPAFVRDLMEELHSFYEYKNKEWSLDAYLFKSEFRRLLKRHIPSNSELWTEMFNGILITDLITEVFVYMADPNKNEQVKRKSKRQYTKENFEHFLQIALFLAREQIGGVD